MGFPLLRKTAWVGPSCLCKRYAASDTPVARIAPSPRLGGERAGITARLLIRPESEQFRSIVGSDLAPVPFGDAGEDVLEEILRLRPGRLGMREVAPPPNGLDPDMLARLDAEIVLHELDEHIAPPVIARQHALAGFPALGEHRPLAIGKVHLLQPMGDPRRLVLDRADLQPWVAIEHTGEQHRRQRVSYPMVGGRAAGPGQLTDVYRELATGNTSAIGGDMH